MSSPKYHKSFNRPRHPGASIRHMPIDRHRNAQISADRALAWFALTVFVSSILLAVIYFTQLT
jgi:hypothetical protein